MDPGVERLINDDALLHRLSKVLYDPDDPDPSRRYKSMVMQGTTETVYSPSPQVRSSGFSRVTPNRLPTPIAVWSL